MKMKQNKFSAIFPAFLLTALIFVSACAPADLNNDIDKKCRVVLAESACYGSAEYIKEVPRGSDAEFTLIFNNGYTFGGASYGDYGVQTSAPDSYGERTVRLTLRNVRYPSYVSVEAEKIAKTYSVYLKNSSEFRCENPIQIVSEGESAVFTLLFDGKYTFDGAYSDGGEIRYNATGIDSPADENNERRVVLTVENITAETAITVKAKKAGGSIELQPVENNAVIGYVLNGGEYISEEVGGSYYTVNYPLLHYPRPNTSIGTDVIRRNGFTLTGWNTRADGSGGHIGLGSRASVAKNETLLLYAEWAEWTDKALFDYELINTQNIYDLYMEKRDKRQKLNELIESADGAQSLSAVITGYRGGAERLVIPEEIDGYPVEVIAPLSIMSDDKLKTIIFPVTARYVMERSVLNCPAFTEIYLFDNLHYLDYNAFGTQSPVKTMHINARLAPVYGRNESAQLANKLEYLMLYAEEKKTVLFGSCSTWYGVNAEKFGEETGRLTFNMGVEGDTCILVQLDLIKQFMGLGDTLVYVCDTGSPYLMLYNLSFDARAFRLVEFNYDLLATVDLTRYEQVTGSLGEYLVTKYNALDLGYGGTYDDYLEYVSEFGDMNKERAGSFHDGWYNAVAPQVVKENDAFEKTKAVFEGFVEMGVDIYYGFGTISEESISEELATALNDLFFSEFERVNMPATIIADLYSALLPSNLFYDYAYRLNTEGSLYYTRQFIKNFLRASSGKSA